MKHLRIKDALLRVVQGAIIGAGAILPGISGGVLAVVFGIYRPMMEVLTHPKSALRRYFPMLLAVGIGWVAGFLGGGSVILVLFDQSETVATCLFIGLILGTFPDLWHEAGLQGRGKGSFAAMAVSFAALFSLLLGVQFGSFAEMQANFGGFLFCGVLWGLSFIVPGMTSSSILMSVGLFTPMIDGIVAFDPAVLVPWLLGMLGIVLALARVVDHLFRMRYSLFYHAVIGIVLSSTVVIIPLHYQSAKELALSVLLAAVGAVLAYWSGKIDTNSGEAAKK